MKITPTVKTGFSGDRVKRVERVERALKAKNATEKWKENLYISESEKLTDEEREAVLTEDEVLSNTNHNDDARIIQEAYERFNNEVNPIKDKLFGRK